MSALTLSAAGAWMRDHVEEHRDARTGEVNYTGLAEACCAAFGVDDEGGPLDDGDHWIWDVAADVEVGL